MKLNGNRWRGKTLGTVASVALAASVGAIAPGTPAGAVAGPLDPTFDVDGRVMTPIASAAIARDVAIQPDGKIVVAGYAFNTSSNVAFAVARYNANGSLDTTFDGDGIVITDLTPDADGAFAMALQPDGKIVLAGTTATGSESDIAIARYNADGSPDTSFDGDGRVVTDFATTDDAALDIHVQADGKVVIAGATEGTFSDFAIARYNGDGSLDGSFDGDGKVNIDFGGGTSDDVAYALVQQPDGKFVVVGSAESFSFGGFALARLNGDGSLDTSFDGDGRVLIDMRTGLPLDIATGVALQADGKIVVSGTRDITGSVTESMVTARFNSDGTLDTAFGSQGMVTVDAGPFGDFSNDVLVQPDGKIVMVGTSDGLVEDYVGVIRLLPDGKFDASFAGGGIARTQLGLGGFGSAGALQPDGKLVVAATASNGSSFQFGVLRYNTDSFARLTTIAPVRVLDTRSGGRPPASARIRVNTNAPAGTSAVLVNLTLTRAAGGGYVTADSCSALLPGAQAKSNANFAVGLDVANNSVVNVDPDGAFCLFVSQAVHVIVDVQGYIGIAGSRLAPTSPTRVLNTRTGAKPAANSITRVQTGVPAGTTAVLANITMTRAAGAGYVTADRCTGMVAGPQSKSNGNYVPGIDIANNSVVNVDADGSFCIYADQSVDLIVDIQGTYGPTGGRDVLVVAPRRLIDSRTGVRPPAGTITRVNTGAPAGTTAVLANLTMTGALAAGYLTADRCSAMVPGPQSKSNGNYIPGVDIANNSVIPIDADGSFCVYNDQPVHFLVDLQGTY